MKAFQFTLLFCSFLLSSGRAFAARTYLITVNTSSLSGTSGSMDLNFNPGPLATQGASLGISNFTSDGKVNGSPLYVGSASGSLGSGFTFNNTMGLNDILQSFTFGSTLSFYVTFSGPALALPDGVSTSGSTFAFSIFKDLAGTVPALTSDSANGFGVLINVNLDGNTTVTNNLTSGTVRLVPTVTVVPTSQTVLLSQTISTAIAVAGDSGSVVPTGSVVLTTNGYSSGAMSLANGGATIVIAPGTLPTGNYTLAITYSGDTNYALATTTALLIVSVPPAIGLTGTALTVSQGATNGNASILTLTPVGGFTGIVNLSATLTSTPNGATDLPTLSFAPSATANVASATPVTATLIVSTTKGAPGTVAIRSFESHLFGATTAGGIGAAILLFGFPLRRRRLHGMIVLIVFFALAGSLSGCGKNDAGTTLGNYVVTVTATSGSISAKSNISVTVQ